MGIVCRANVPIDKRIRATMPLHSEQEDGAARTHKVFRVASSFLLFRNQNLTNRKEKQNEEFSSQVITGSAGSPAAVPAGMVQAEPGTGAGICGSPLGKKSAGNAARTAAGGGLKHGR